MPLSFMGNNTTNENSQLSSAIDTFNAAALSFETYYQHLEKRVKELDIELKIKNVELKRNLKEKDEAKNHLNNILESLTTGVVVTDLKGKITKFSGAAEEITGLISEKVKGKHFEEIFYPGFFKYLQIDLKSLNDIQENREFETEIYRAEKKTIHVSLSISTVKNTKGNKVGIVLCLQDITHMKKLEEQASRTGRLTAMGEMAANIAHEIRNPLGSIELFASTLRKDLEGFEELRTVAEHISSGVKSINNIVSNLMLFVRPRQKPDFQLIDIHESLNDLFFYPGNLIGWNDGVELVTSYYAKPLIVKGDSELLKQIFLNLVLNAIQAMPKGGRINISTNKIKAKKRARSLVQIRFADTGSGISSEDMPRIFDPFFTTKKRGTGLGLAIVHNIIKIHSGCIDINSTKEEGTVCIVTFPFWENEMRD